MSAIQTEQVRSEMRPISRILQRDKQAVKRKSVHGIGSVGALHGHALAIANEAMAGYREFANHAADRGHDELADLFSRLFELEAEQAFRLPEAAADMLPRLATGEYGWLYSAEPLPEARDLISCMLTPRLALKIALDAQALRAGGERSDPDPAGQRLARGAVCLCPNRAAAPHRRPNAGGGLPQPFLPNL